MKISMKPKPSVFPMPVLMVGTYDENNTVDVMMAAWGMTYKTDKIILNLMAEHKTVKNIQRKKAFTVAIGDEKHLPEEDYLGTVSGNREPEKFSKTALHAVKSEHIDAPVIEEFPLTMECVLDDIQLEGNLAHIIGKIVNISVDESCLSPDGQPDMTKLRPVMWDTFSGDYYAIGGKLGHNCTEYKKMN